MVVLVAAGALIGPSVLGHRLESPQRGRGPAPLQHRGGPHPVPRRNRHLPARDLPYRRRPRVLVLPGVLITAVIVALVVWPVFGVAFPVALLIGAVLAATDPAILIPLFDRLKLRPKVSQTVIAESAFNDVTGTVLTLTLVGVAEAGSFTLSGPAWDFVRELVLGAVIGVVAGLDPLLRHRLDGALRHLGRVAGGGHPRGGRARLLLDRVPGRVRLPRDLRNGPHDREHGPARSRPPRRARHATRRLPRAGRRDSHPAHLRHPRA